MNQKKVLLAKGIRKTFYSPTPFTVLNGISLELHQGDSVAIMGKSGEGKSTLLQILGTLDTPSSGELEICGLSTSSTPLPLLRNKYIGFIFQSFHLLEESTVLENVLMPARIARLPVHPQSPSYHRALLLLEQVGLKNRETFLAKLLSGGEKQRVALARALCNDPSLILADEPSGNLDRTHSKEIHELLMCLCQEHRKALIIVTHDLELGKLCDRVYTLKGGVLDPK